jgi:hypothetical protein
MRLLKSVAIQFNGPQSALISGADVGARSCRLTLFNTFPDDALHINDPVTGQSATMATWFAGVASPGLTAYAWVPTSTGDIEIQTASTGTITGVARFYDEEPFPLEGNFETEIDGVVIPASGTDVGRFVFPGLFRNLQLFVQVSRASIIHLDVYLTPIFGILDYQLSTIVAATGGSFTYTGAMTFPAWQLRVKNSDAVNTNTLSVIAQSYP